jgi:hypothetical protein
MPRNVVELAEEGNWVIGTGGADPQKSAGHGKLVYAMRVDKRLTREDYYADSRFERKIPVKTGTPARTLGDNLRPAGDFQKREQFALISWNFYYFGANAICIPERFSTLEKKGPGFKKRFDPALVRSFVAWLQKNHKPGKHGEPQHRGKPEGSRRCKSSC